jgi:hypothetical protein
MGGLTEARTVNINRSRTYTILNALLPSILDRAFKGEL